MTDNKPKGRIYLVVDKEKGTKTPVRARNADTGLSFVTRGRFSVRPATVDDFIRPEDVLDATVPGVHPDQQPLAGV